MPMILADNIMATEEPARPGIVPSCYVFVPHNTTAQTPAGWSPPRSTLSKINKRELVECAHRELSKRESFYPRWVLRGKLRQRDADREIAHMRTIYRVLSHLSDEAIAEAQE